MTRKQAAVFNPVAAAYETSAGLCGAALTISLRTIRFQQGLFTGRTYFDPENTRMVAEKVAALGEGYAEGVVAWWRLATVNPLSFAAVAGRVGDAVLAPSRPALARARANAKRLTRSRRRR